MVLCDTQAAIEYIEFKIKNAPIAQLVEQLPFKEWVVGSTPTGRTHLEDY